MEPQPGEHTAPDNRPDPRVMSRVDAIVRRLSAEDMSELEEGLTLLEESPELLRGDRRDDLLAAVFMLFLLDTVDHPEVEGVIGRAVRLVSSLGTEAVPMLLRQLDDSDIKGHVHLVRALIGIGMPAMPQIIDYHDCCTGPLNRAFALYALSKLNDPGIVEAVPLALKDMSSKHHELRDTATRSLGKLVEFVPASAVSEEVKREMFETTRARTTDPVPGIRAKALRTLGKLAAHAYLNEECLAVARRHMETALGLGGSGPPDRAFIVRREAEIALARMSGSSL